jgi:16S rRNA (guanine527-N7)-methyltransferase
VNSREFQERLLRRARRAGVVLPVDLGTRLEIYYRLLATWNQKINLTGLNLAEPTPEALDRLLIEPLVAARHVANGQAPRLIDVGSGGGSPAIPFALALSGSRLLLVESKTRKSVFLREALRALEMASSDVATARFEELLSKPDLHEAHDILTVRAVRIEARVLMGLQAFVRPGGQLLLFRSSAGPDPSDALTPPLNWKATFPLVESLRSRLVVIEKRAHRR